MDEAFLFEQRFAEGRSLDAFKVLSEVTLHLTLKL